MNSEPSLSQRLQLLVKIDEFTARKLNLIKRHAAAHKLHFAVYASFFTSGAFNLIAWEQIAPYELQELPAIKRYFLQAIRAARKTHWRFGSYDPASPQGGRRTFADIALAQQAACFLPRLEGILQCWGIRLENKEGIVFTERELTFAETCDLESRYKIK